MHKLFSPLHLVNILIISLILLISPLLNYLCLWIHIGRWFAIILHDMYIFVLYSVIPTIDSLGLALCSGSLELRVLDPELCPESPSPGALGWKSCFGSLGHGSHVNAPLMWQASPRIHQFSMNVQYLSDLCWSEYFILIKPDAIFLLYVIWIQNIYILSV